MTAMPCIPVYPETVVTHWAGDHESGEGPRVDWFDGESSWTWTWWVAPEHPDDDGDDSA